MTLTLIEIHSHEECLTICKLSSRRQLVGISDNDKEVHLFWVYERQHCGGACDKGLLCYLCSTSLPGPSVTCHYSSMALLCLGPAPPLSTLMGAVEAG